MSLGCWDYVKKIVVLVHPALNKCFFVSFGVELINLHAKKNICKINNGPELALK